VYVLGLVVIASDSDRFWIGMTLAGVPILVGVVTKLGGGAR
jgi:hypothetical protein